MHRRRPIALSAFAGVLWLGMPALAIAEAPPVAAVRPAAIASLTVLQPADRAEWDTLRPVLGNVPYTAISSDRLATLTPSPNATLLLPNLERLSAAEADALSAWVQKGGRLVVTGPLGLQSEAQVQAKLRSLVGGYWNDTIADPTRFLPRSDSLYDWARSVPPAQTPLSEGGALIPSDGRTRTVAFWPNNSPAILVKGNVLFLGWRWGKDPELREFDRNWLVAAVNRPAISERIATVVDPEADPLLPAASTNPGSGAAFSTLPINTLEAIAMRRDLEELVGRVENAVLRASSAPDDYGSVAKQQEAIDNARAFLKTMRDDIAAGKHAEVRARWQQSRETLWRNYPVELLTAIPEVRAIWLDRGTIVAAKSPAGLEKIFDRLAAAGVNTVFLETVNAGYPIYPSRVAPQQNPLTVGWDPLAAAVTLAKARNMELHAWVWVFGVGNRRHNALVGKPADYPGSILSAYPQWASRGRNGELLAPEGKFFLDPANPEAQEYLLRLYREIVTRYDVDGLQLDYIRYPRQDPGRDFGFGQTGRARFTALTGIDPLQLTPNDRSLWWLWTEFRTQQVNDFVARVAREMRQAKPNLVLSAAVFPWQPLERITRMQQHWETWIGRGDIDLLVPMTYAPETSTFLRDKVEPALESVAKSPVLFLPGVLIRDVPDVQLVDKLQALRDLPAMGFALFAAEHLRPSFIGLLNNVKNGEAAKIVPYRQPFAAAQSRFASLRREWQSLLDRQTLWVRGETLQQWQQQTEALDRALVALRQHPTPTAMKAASDALAETQNNLPKWLRLESLERPYRLATWMNQLEVIEGMLRYGDRVVLQRQIQPATAAAGDRPSPPASSPTNAMEGQPLSAKPTPQP